MDTQFAIESRRSVKQFAPAHSLMKQEIESLLSLGLLSPTALNIPPRGFDFEYLRMVLHPDRAGNGRPTINQVVISDRFA